MQPETIVIDSQLFQYIMVVMYGVFSLMVIVVGAYIALFKRSIENKIESGFKNSDREFTHINNELQYLRAKVDNHR